MFLRSPFLLLLRQVSLGRLLLRLLQSKAAFFKGWIYRDLHCNPKLGQARQQAAVEAGLSGAWRPFPDGTPACSSLSPHRVSAHSVSRPLKQCVVLSVFLLWFDVSCVSSLLFFCPPPTFDLSDLETSFDSRCTTDSADSAFIGRRYWSLASPFSPFLFSSHPIPSSPTEEVRLQIT